MQDALLELLTSIKEYAKQNSIVVLKGTPLEESKFISIPVEVEKGDWLEFFSLIQGLELKGVNIFVYKVHEGMIDEVMVTYYHNLEGDKKKEYKHAMDTLKSSIGFIESITLSFFYQNVRYFLEVESELTQLETCY